MSKKVTMDILCELASSLTEYIVGNYTDYPIEELEVTMDNGDLRYSNRVQDIFNNVIDTCDDILNPETGTRDR